MHVFYFYFHTYRRKAAINNNELDFQVSLLSKKINANNRNQGALFFTLVFILREMGVKKCVINFNDKDNM